MKTVGKMTDEDLSRYVAGLTKKAVHYRAELVLNPFDLNAIHNLNLLDNMVVSAISRYLNQ